MRFSSRELNSEREICSFLIFKQLQPLTRYETQALKAAATGSSVTPQQSSLPSPADPARPWARPRGEGEQAAAAPPDPPAHTAQSLAAAQSRARGGESPAGLREAPSGPPLT